MKRSEIFDEWKRANVVVDDGLAYRTDELTEALHHEWKKRGSTHYAYVSIEGESTLVVATVEAPELE